jgi:hypothetical protein
VDHAAGKVVIGPPGAVAGQRERRLVRGPGVDLGVDLHDPRAFGGEDAGVHGVVLDVVDADDCRRPDRRGRGVSDTVPADGLDERDTVRRRDRDLVVAHAHRELADPRRFTRPSSSEAPRVDR